jgi:NADPH2 dehydrogenase
VDQFTQDVVNKRTDRWGGSIENRSRFGLEVAKAVTAAVGSHRTGIRLSPWSTFQAMKMDDPIPQFTHLIKGLREIGLSYLHLVESRVQGIFDVESSDRLDFAVDAWADKSPIFMAGGFTADIAKQTVDSDYKDHEIAVVFGRYFISTPDLAFRIEHGLELNPYNRKTFYSKESAEGYTDYPFSADFEKTLEARL